MRKDGFLFHCIYVFFPAAKAGAIIHDFCGDCKGFEVPHQVRNDRRGERDKILARKGVWGYCIGFVFV